MEIHVFPSSFFSCHFKHLGLFVFGVLQDLAEPPKKCREFVSSLTMKTDREVKKKRPQHWTPRRYSGGWRTWISSHKNCSPIYFGKAFPKSWKSVFCFTENNSRGSLPFQTLPASCFKKRLQPADLHLVDPPAVFHQFSKHFFGKNPRCSMPNS